jgi:hypothetical protein
MGLYLFVAAEFGIGIAHKMNRLFILYQVGSVIRGRVTCCFFLRSVGFVGVFCLLVCRDVGSLGIGTWHCCCHGDCVGSVFGFFIICTAPLVSNSFMMPGWRSWYLVLAQASAYAKLLMCPLFFWHLQNRHLQRPKAWPQQRVCRPLREDGLGIIFLQWSIIEDREGLSSLF